MTTVDSARELLQQMCCDLRTLRQEAGGPSLRAVAQRIQIGKSQLGAILNGQVREPPDWRVVRGMVDCMVRHAEDHGRSGRLSLPRGVDEFWRNQYAMVEHAFAHLSGRRAPTTGAEYTSPAVAAPGSAGAAPAPSNVEPVLALPRQLPPAVRQFIGRKAELGDLDGLLSVRGPADPGTVVVIDGMAGVGKTTLAVQWAHEVAVEFPDIQLYANLRGFDPCGQVMAPAEAVRGFIESLGVPRDRIPPSLDAQTALYRSLLSGKRVLVLLDNARDAEQVRPLLPGTPGALTLVTSRDQLTPLVAVDCAHRITLEPLTADEARDLLVERLGEQRVVAEPEAAVDRIITGCARLPLALAVAAARAQQLGFPLAGLAEQLGNARERLDALDAGDPASRLRSVFSWSYAALSPAGARLFRLLGLPAGEEISIGAAASLAGQQRAETRSVLAELTRANLLVEHAPGRYGCHELLRTYAAELARRHDPQPLRRAAIARMLDHYLQTADTADRLLDPHRDPIHLPLADPLPGTDVEHLADRAAATAWLTLERPTLLVALRRAAAEHADAAGHRSVWQLAWVLDTFLRRQGHWGDRTAAWRAALRAADRMGDPVARAHAHRYLADVQQATGRPVKAYVNLGQALALYERAGDRLGQAYCRYCLAAVRSSLGIPQSALAHARQALELFRAVGSVRGEAAAHNAMGQYNAQLGEYRKALTQCGLAIALQQPLGDLGGQAATWDSLGYAHHHLADYGRAADCYRRAIALYRGIEDRCNEAVTLAHLGDTLRAAEDLSAARTAWRQALETLTPLRHPQAERVCAGLQRMKEESLSR